jgi:hypothetical protein
VIIFWQSSEYALEKIINRDRRIFSHFKRIEESLVTRQWITLQRDVWLSLWGFFVAAHNAAPQNDSA